MTEEIKLGNYPEDMHSAIRRLQVLRNSQEDAVPELLNWAAEHIEALADRIRRTELDRSIGGVLVIDMTEEELKNE